MLIYIGNFVFTTLYFRSVNIYLRVGLPTVLMYLIVYLCGKFQVIGLTGGIACGKSVLTKFFKGKVYKKNVYIEGLRIQAIDCDILARKVVEVDKPAYKKIVQYFGNRVLNEDKTINRTLLGEIIFNN